MKKKIFICLTAALISIQAYAFDEKNVFKGFDFVAPIVPVISTSTPDQTGLIVFDADANKFYGRGTGTDGTGREGWIDLSYSGVESNTQYDLDVSGTDWTTTRAVGIAYQTSVGWRLRFNIVGALSSASATITLTIEDVLFKNVSGYYQAVSCYPGAENWSRADVAPNTNTLVARAGETVSIWSFSGDVELESEPTFMPR